MSSFLSRFIHSSRRLQGVGLLPPRVQHLAQARVCVCVCLSLSLSLSVSLSVFARSHTCTHDPHLQTGEGLRDGEVLEWFVGPGDAVKQYDLLCRVQSDKATIDVPSAFDGTIQSLSSQVGDIVAVGEPLCVFGGDDNSTASQPTVASGLGTSRAPPAPAAVHKLTSYRRSMMRAMQQVRVFSVSSPCLLRVFSVSSSFGPAR